LGPGYASVCKGKELGITAARAFTVGAIYLPGNDSALKYIRESTPRGQGRACVCRPAPARGQAEAEARQSGSDWLCYSTTREPASDVIGGTRNPSDICRRDGPGYCGEAPQWNHSQDFRSRAPLLVLRRFDCAGLLCVRARAPQNIVHQSNRIKMNVCQRVGWRCAPKGSMPLPRGTERACRKGIRSTHVVSWCVGNRYLPALFSR
jgi:hypothetical protein